MLSFLCLFRCIFVCICILLRSLFFFLLRLDEIVDIVNVPVIVGECGADFKGNEVTRKAYVEHYFSNASEYEIKCFWWDTGAMALFDRNTCSEKYPEITEIIMNNCG